LGTNAFVGGKNANIAGAPDSGVLSGYSNTVCEVRSAIGTGGQNRIGSAASTANDSFIGAGDLNNVTAAAKESFIGAGNSNLAEAQDSAIGAGTQNTNNGSYSVIGAGSGNRIGTGQEIPLNYDFVGGGDSNAVQATYSVIGGGQGNAVWGNAAFIGGGAANLIGTPGKSVATYGVIGGGQSNAVQGNYAVVLGGYKNQANGLYATVPGGENNVADGIGSFAAGNGSEALHNGTFVWSDDASGATQLKSTGVNQFLARASGGYVFYTNSVLTSGAKLPAGSGSWSSLSDRNMKTDIAAVDGDEILNRIAALPISRWSYISEGHIRHIGPMAQDFYAAFGLGEDDKHITSIDEEGVAYAAIQALQGRLQNLKAIALRAAAMRQAHLRNQATIAALHRREAALESQLRSLR